MDKFKSAVIHPFNHLTKFGPPSDEDFALIKTLTPSDIVKDDIFVYSIKLCDNLIDRDGEYFSHSALEQLSEMFKGRVGISDHKWSSENIHSRIYKTELSTSSDAKNEMLEPYECLIGFAYTLNNEKNADLIADINAGIKSEVSIGFKANSYTPKQTPEGITAVEIADITDCYEYSFVAVPSQRGAGVVKHFNKEGINMGFKEALVGLKSVPGVDHSVVATVLKAVEDLEQGVSAVTDLNTRIKSLEDDVNAKSVRVKELEAQIKTATLDGAVAQVMSGLTPLSEKAAELVHGIVLDGLSIGEDGKASGIDELKTKLKGEYSFLFTPDGGSDDSEGAGTKTATQPRRIDFTHTPTTGTKSVSQPVARGISFN